MKKYVKCFSNATEATTWQFKNCDQCTRKTVCYAKRAIELGFISGHITWKIAKFIGYKSCHSSNIGTEDDYCRLNDVCDSFNKPIFKMARQKVQDKNDLTLF
jgi:hypothetical protein